MKTLVDFLTAFDTWQATDPETTPFEDAIKIEDAMARVRKLVTPELLDWLDRLGSAVSDLSVVTDDAIGHPRDRRWGPATWRERSAAARRELAALLSEARTALVPRLEETPPAELAEVGLGPDGVCAHAPDDDASPVCPVGHVDDCGSCEAQPGRAH
jgi:hypothetical protein